MKRAIRAGLLAGAALLSSCIVEEVQVGYEGPQCRIDLDCRRGGLDDLICVGGTCEPKPADSGLQCRNDVDCVRQSPLDTICVEGVCVSKPFDPTWACLDGPPLEPTTATVDLRLEVIGAITREHAVGALVRACSRIDPACAAPLVPDTPVGANGQVILPVPESFDGYFEVRSAADEPDQFIPEMVYLPRRELMRRGGPVRRALLFTEAEAQQLLAPVGGTFTLDQAPNAFALAVALDCLGELSPQVSVTPLWPSLVSDQTVAFYTDRNNVPQTEALETGASGTFGLTNLVASSTAGPLALTARINPLKRTIAPDTLVLVRDNWVTVVYLASL